MCWDSRAADSTARACRRETLLALMKEKLLNKLTFFFGVVGSAGVGQSHTGDLVSHTTTLHRVELALSRTFLAQAEFPPVTAGCSCSDIVVVFSTRNTGCLSMKIFSKPTEARTRHSWGRGDKQQ